MSDENSSFDDLAELLGADKAAALCEKMGGTSIYVPERPSGKAFRDLVATLDRQHAEILQETCAREQLYIPLARRQVVTFLRKQGVSTKEIARRAQASLQYVRHIIRQNRAAGAA